MKTSLLRSKTTIISFFWLIIYIYLVVDRILIDVYDFQISFYFINNIFILLKIEKNMLKIIAILMSISKKIF